MNVDRIGLTTVNPFNLTEKNRALSGGATEAVRLVRPWPHHFFCPAVVKTMVFICIL